MPPISRWESDNRNDVLEDIARGKSDGRYKDCAHLSLYEYPGPIYGDAYRFSTTCHRDSLQMPSEGSHTAAAAMGLRITPLREPRCPDTCHSFEPTPERKRAAEVERRRDEAVSAIEAQLAALEGILSEHDRPTLPGYERVPQSALMKESLTRWVSHTRRIIKEKVSENEARDFADKSRAFHGNWETGVDRCRSFLTMLKRELVASPEIYFSPSAPVDSMTKPSMPVEQVVFIVHGHDEANTAELDRLLKDEFKLRTIILKTKPAQGRTIIEKFEAEAAAATFAFVLLTTDDLVKGEDAEYLQARPNVLFELGWFYSKLKRARTVLLWKKGGKLPTDLQGIEHLEFRASVREVFLQIRDELAAAGVIGEQK